MQHIVELKQKVEIYEFKYPYFEKLNDELEKDIRISGDVQNKNTSCRCYMTSFNMRTPSFKKLMDYIIACLNDHGNFNELWRGSWEVGNVWGLIYKENEYALTHHHFPATYSFVYYVRCPEGSAPIIFNQFEFYPKEGDILIFPSLVEHRVSQHKINKERIIVSGNLYISTEYVKNKFS